MSRCSISRGLTRFSLPPRVTQRRDPAAGRPFEVFTVAQSAAPVKARAGRAVLADFVIGQHSAIDLLIVPGGVVSAELVKPAVVDWISATAGQAHLTAAVCTGTFLLNRAGLLDNL